jgi:cell division septation protein DedD
VYQYYYSIGLYRTATQKYDQLKRAYPSSPYLVQGELSSVNRGDEAAERLGSVDDAGSGTFAVQVGAFSTTENANRQKRFFHSAGYPVEILNKVKGGRSFYLVWIGNFKSYDEAREFGNEVKRRYKINTIVVGR